MSSSKDQQEFCPRCDANLTLQKGYRNDLPYWICKGCGEMLINPEIDTDSDIVWLCDGCGEMLNIQPGFSEEHEEWTCTECGFVNKIADSEVYESEDEYQADLTSPYKGITDEDLLKLSRYQSEEPIAGRNDVFFVRDRESGNLFVKKLLSVYDRSVYEYLLTHPVSGMPRIHAVFEGANCLIVIEEYLDGKTLEELLEDGPFSKKEAFRIAKALCVILDELHHLPTPIVHRDVKPSNVMITGSAVRLLDMNAAKWYDPEKKDDTRHLGTQYYAAPEQAGYGFGSSSPKADIYALGMLINVMLTGKFPKQEMPEGMIREVIERCISLDAKDRYTAAELLSKLDEIDGG